MGSEKDLEVMQKASATLADFEVPHDVKVISAHKTPDRAIAFAAAAEEEGYGAIIVEQARPPIWPASWPPRRPCL